LGTGVSEYFLLNHNSAESRILPDLAVILILKISDTTFLLDEVFFNFALMGEKKSEAN
jgi:hypothetical protein